ARTAVQRFLFPKFFPKKFGQKIGAGPPMEDFGNGTCAGPVLLHPAPPFVQMKNTRGLSFRRHSGSVPAGRADSVGCSVRQGATLPLFDIAAEFTVFAVVPINQPTSQTLGPRLGERASRTSEVVIAGSAWHQEGHGLPTALQKRQLWQRRFLRRARVPAVISHASRPCRVAGLAQKWANPLIFHNM